MLNFILQQFIQMGGQQSKQQQDNQVKEVIETDPLIKKLRNNLRLKIDVSNQNFHFSNSFIHRDFSQQLKKHSKGRIQQKFSPFCAIYVQSQEQQTKEVHTCSLISPIMALLPSYKLCNTKGMFNDDFNIMGYGKVFKKKSIKNVVQLSTANIGLLFLQEPLWQLGWCGLAYYLNPSKLSQATTYAIENYFHRNDKKVTQLQDQSALNQKIQKLYFNISNYKGKTSSKGQQLIFTINDGKPYLIGSQQDNQCSFFTHQVYEQIKNIVNGYLKPSVQRQILKEIDIIQLQMQSQW